jgi:hypothetical protein
MSLRPAWLPILSQKQEKGLLRWLSEALGAQPEDLNSDPRSLIKGRERPASQGCPPSSTVYSGIHGYTHTHNEFKYSNNTKTANCVL